MNGRPLELTLGLYQSPQHKIPRFAHLRGERLLWSALLAQRRGGPTDQRYSQATTIIFAAPARRVWAVAPRRCDSLYHDGHQQSSVIASCSLSVSRSAPRYRSNRGQSCHSRILMTPRRALRRAASPKENGRTFLDSCPAVMPRAQRVAALLASPLADKCEWPMFF